MNGLSLRISTGSKKTKNIISLSPAVVTNLPDDIAQNEKVQPFLQAATASEQLAALNQLLKLDADDKDVMKLLVIVYFHSEAKHPVKCFLTRHITKNKQLQEPFIDLLSSEISLYLKDEHTSYKSYRDTVSKIGMCLESFPAGTSAVENIGQILAPYLNCCFECCLDTVRKICLSPTEKSVVYSLAHLTLRILLHIITKIQLKLDHNDDHTKLCKALYTNMKESLHAFLMDSDMPMDTKSVCGLVALALDAYRYDNGPNHDAWRNFLYSNGNVSMSEGAQLAMFSAIITAVPMRRLQEKQNLDELTPIETIVLKLMDIVEKCSSDGVLILGVARALGRLSKSLPELEVELGVQVSEILLGFVWSHLEHYMDSVRHQAAQLLATTVQYCAQLEINGSSSVALSSALHRLSELGAGRRGYHAGVRGVARVVPASRLLPAAPPARLLPALLQGELTSTVSYTLEDLLTRHSKEVGASLIYEQWVLPILHFARTHDLEPQILTTLENLLDKALQLNKDLVSFILPHIKQACESPEDDLKNVLVLLSVARPSLAKLNLTLDGERWGGVLPYEVLNEAVVDARDEVRVTGLGLACKGEAKAPTLGELVVLRQYLAHCGRETSHARQLARPMLAKFVRRLYDAHRAALRNGDKEQERHILQLIEEIRQDCYGGLTRGASLARRATSLELLLEVETPSLCRSWKVEYVEKLLMHLDDSYETNKRYAVELLCRAPQELLEIDSPILQVEDILSSACALRPAECATAAVRLELVWRRLPQRLMKETPCTCVQPALFSALASLLARVSHTYDALRAPRDGPTYGLLHCMASLLDIMDPETIVGDKEWDDLIVRIIDMCRHVLEGAGSVVDRAAPEGALPPDCRYTDYGNNAGVMLEDGRQVTAQMVLLCAWRTVKEATGVLGSLGARLRLACPGPAGACSLAELLGRVLASARHRGAFEQAYVAFERVLARMWVDPAGSVASWPARQLALTLAQLRDPATSARLADRRSAGLPFLIQAIVSTEPGAGGPGTGLRDVMTALLERAGGGGEGGAGGAGEAGANDRAHACNVLRALYRDSSLDSAVQGFVGDGLRVALQGFEGATWTERNSSTLLLSALVTRVFGVSRSRAQLSSRNRMTGRVFYLRYPHLYDVMLNKLKEANSSEEKLLLCPSLYPVLLLLGRLYPSSLEGTESNLKLVSFVPLLVALARSRVLLTRRLAAAAAVPLVAPDRYVPHLQYLLGLVSESRVQMNFCHGVLLQICALLEHKPAGVNCSPLADAVPSTSWLLGTSCWPVLHQYALLLSALKQRFPETLQQETLDTICAQLRRLSFENKAAPPASGRSLALAACLRLLLELTSHDDDIADLIVQSLRHDVSEVCETALDYLLTIDEDGTRRKLRAHPEYLPSLAEPLRRDEFWKKEPLRAYKHLEVLVAEGDTQELIISGTHQLAVDDVIHQLSRLIESGTESITHLYLDSLTSYISPRLTSLSVQSLQCYCGTLFSCCLPRRADRARLRAARALHDHGLQVLRTVEGEDFNVESYVWLSAAQLLRDTDADVQTRAAAAAMRLAGHSTHRSVVPERATALLLEACASRARGAALLTTLALCSSLPPELDTNQDEWRIFEPRDQEIALAEEKQWACACADKVVDLCARQGIDPLTHVTQALDQCLPYLDSGTVDAVKKLAAGENVLASPVVELFVNKLKGV